MDKKTDAYMYLKERLVAWIREEMRKSGGKYAVIGISGGKDSTVVAALAVEALGADHVIGLMLPNGEQKDIADAIRVCEVLGIKHETININPAYEAILGPIAHSSVFKEIVDVEGHGQLTVSELNTPPRVRMTILRAMANAIPGGRFLNTSNMSEFFMGYFTKDGDSCGDLFPILALTKTEIVEIGRLCKKLPIELVEKAPADGLTGKTDEEVLGVDYDSIDEYLRLCESGGNMEGFAYLRAQELMPICAANERSAHKIKTKNIFFVSNKRKTFFTEISK